MSALNLEGKPQVIEGIGMERFQTQNLPETVGCLVPLALILESESQIIMDPGIGGVVAQALTIAGDTFLALSHGHESLAQVVGGVGMLRVYPQGSAITRTRLDKLSLLQESVTQMDVGLDVNGVDCQGLPKVLGRLGELPHVHEEDAHLGLVTLQRRVQGDGLTQQANRGLMVSGLMGQKTQHEMSLSMGGICLKNLPIKRLRLHKVATLVILQGKL